MRIVLSGSNFKARVTDVLSMFWETVIGPVQHASEFALVFRAFLWLLSTERTPSGVWIGEVGDKRSDSISFSGHVEYLRTKDWMWVCNVVRFEFQILGVFKHFHSAERIQKCVDSQAGFAGYVCGRKANSQIQKYPDSCGTGSRNRDKRNTFDTKRFDVSTT